MEDTRIENKIALITGSNRGIGKGIADKFEDAGITVIKNGLSDSDDKLYVKGDVGVSKDIVKIKEFVTKKFGKLDILVNNAAFTKFVEHKDLHKLSNDLFDKIYSTNLRGPFLCTQIFHELLSKSDGPSIINIASVAGINGQGSNIAYCAMKAALINMTKSLARCLAPIRVNAISPGLVETGFVQFPKGFVPETISKTPLNRTGQPGDIGDAALSLVNMKYITGENITVDGGRLLN